MTSQGSVHGQFQRALKRGNGTIALGLAHEVTKVSLADALRLCWLLRDDPKFSRFVPRWHARYVTEIGVTSYTESQLVLTSLFSLSGEHAEAAQAALERIFAQHGRDDLVRAFEPPHNPLAPSAS